MSAVSDAPAPPSYILRYAAPGQRYAGAVDFINEAIGLRGWVVDIAVAGQPVALSAVVDDVVVASAHAMMDRPDIDKVIGRVTQSSFLIGWSMFDHVRLAAAAAANPDAPVNVRVEATGQLVPVTVTPLSARAALAALRAAPRGDRQSRFAEVHDYHAILRSGLFDEAWYRDRYAADLSSGLPPILDYLRLGEIVGRRPNFYFDPTFYAAAAGRPTPKGALAGYLAAGAGGASPSPHFEEAWYRGRYDVPDGTSALADYLAHRGERAPNRFFDATYYLDATGETASDPYLDFVSVGREMGFFPSKAVAEAAQDNRLAPDAAAFLTAVARETDPRAAAVAPGALAAAVPAPPAPSAPPPVVRPEPPAAAPAPPFMPAVAPPPDPPALLDPAPSAAGIPAAARLGWHATEALLAGLEGPHRAATLSLARAALAGSGPERADAALTLAVARAAAGDTAAATAAAVVFLGEPPAGDPGTQAETETRILALAHERHEAREPREAEEIYRLIFGRGRRDDLLVLRLLEAAVDRGEAAAAVLYADILKASPEATANPWAVIAIARAQLLSGRKAEAVRLLSGLPPFPTTPAIAESVILNLLVNADAAEVAAARAETSADDRTPALFAAHFRLAVWRQDVRAIAKMAADEQAAQLPNWQLGEAMFRLGAPGKLPLAQQHAVMAHLFRLTESRGLDDNAIVQARLHFLLHNKRWDELGALFAEIDRTPLAQTRETLLRKLEYTAHAGTVADAEALYRDHFATSELNKWESLTVLRLLSELKRWDEAGEVLLKHVGNGYDFGTGGHIAIRVVRKARLHENTIAAAGKVRGLKEPGLDTFIGVVSEDAAILDRAISLSPKPRGDEARPQSRYRSNWILEGPGLDDDDMCMFLCTNQKYFLSALTFLTSFFGQAPQVGCKIYVFLDGDVPRNWHGMFTLVAARFNRQIEVVLESEFVTTAAEHKVDYGFFAGGSNLARAAYYRLYAARWLIDKHDFRRALYVDTDIVCRGDLRPLFEVDFGDALLGAAVEDYSIEVVNAASRNNLDPYRYFNSGVLSFRMDDPRLSTVLDEAIRVSEVEPQRLSFHDQCALNIAFENKFVPLASRFNFYLRPSRERNGFIEDGLLLHFVDKPKPWDIVFDRTYREEWRVWALMLGTFLPQGLYVDIFSAANRD